MNESHDTQITRHQAIAYLLRDGGTTPGSRYGYHSNDMVDVVWRAATYHARQAGQPVTVDLLDFVMRLAVNNHPDVEQDAHQYAAELVGANIGAMVDGYIDCQLWAQLDMDRLDEQGDSPTLDENYDRSDVAPEYVEQLRAEFGALVYAHPLAVRLYLAQRNGIDRYQPVAMFDASAQFGHDYYLTREGHGAGFWDRGLGELGDYLTEISNQAGSADDLSDDGQGVLR